MSSNEEVPPTVTKPDPPTDRYCIPTNLGEDDGITFTSSLTSVNDLTTSPVKHKCYDVLTGGRRPQLKTMPYRKDLIARILALRKDLFLPSDMMMSPNVLAWYSTNNAHAKQPRKWDRFIMAKAICDFDDMLTEARKVGASKPCDVIAEFHKYMDDVREAASIKENEPTVNKKGKIGAQKGGKRLQDSVDLNGITREDLSVTNCASCKHNFLYPVGQTQLEIHHHNDSMKGEYRQKMVLWNAMTASRRGPKPKIGKSLSQKLMCLCTRLHCLNRTGGNGCFKCEWACLEAVNQNSEIRPYFDSDMNCMCPVCTCQCSVVYYRHEEKNLQFRQRKNFFFRWTKNHRQN